MISICIEYLFANWVGSYTIWVSIVKTNLTLTYRLFWGGHIKHVLICGREFILKLLILTWNMRCTYITLSLDVSISIICYVNIFLRILSIIKLSPWCIVFKLVINNCSFLTWILCLNRWWHLTIEISRIILLLLTLCLRSWV